MERRHYMYRLNVEEFEKRQKLLGLRDGEIADQIGITREHLWRMKLPINHHNFSGVGAKSASQMLKFFGAKPVELFFFD